MKPTSDQSPYKVKAFVARSGSNGSGRKNYWMPCVINATFDDKSPEEQAAILKATKWADLITNTEWPVMLQDVRNPPVRSRLKKKITYWLMAMGRIARLNPELFKQAAMDAIEMYAEQIQEDHPLFLTLSDGCTVMAVVVHTHPGHTTSVVCERGKDGEQP